MKIPQLPAGFLPIPPPPDIHAHSALTFAKPALDGSLTVSQIYDWHYQHSPNHPLFIYSDGPGSTRTILWSEVIPATHRVARFVDRTVQALNLPGGARPVIAIVAASDTISYFTLLAGIIRAHCVAFPISPRNSAAAVAHLLRATGASHVFVGHEATSQDLAATTLSLIKSEYSDYHQPTTLSPPLFDELYANTNEDFDPLPPFDADMAAPAFILHSSGSTAFPKPIPFSHLNWLCNARCPYFGDCDLAGKRFSCHALPMYHGMGLMQTTWTASTGVTLTVWNPKASAIFSSPDVVYQGIVDTNSDIVLCVPVFVETWAQNSERVERLKELDAIIAGGGPLNEKISRALSRAGVQLFSAYGTTELGLLTRLLPREPEPEYFKISPQFNAHFVPNGYGQFELVVLAGSETVPHIFNGTFEGQDACYTNDLLTPHPSRSGFWKVYGRNDDQIMHSTGEKTNPGPLEGIVNQDPHILSSVMFGRGQFNAGIIVDPTPSHKFDPSDEFQLSKFRNDIWPTIQRMNEYAPQQSHLFKEMILVASPSKPFGYTAKNTPRRHALVALYEDEIKDLYKAVGETTHGDTNIPTPVDWSLTSVLPYVRAVVQHVLQKPSLPDDVDIFQTSCDSLQATWIRNTISRAIGEQKRLNANILPSDVVFENPTIASLARFISTAALDSSAAGYATSTVDKVDAMRQLVKRYTQDLPERTQISSVQRTTKDVVLVTGTTGSFGAQILAALVGDNSVARIYAVNRRLEGAPPVADRQRAMFDNQGVDASILSSDKVVLVEVDVDGEWYGLDPKLLDEVRASVTHIVHNAWRVDFNLALTSFEPNIRGVRQLVDLALSSHLAEPPKIIFISSIAVARGADRSTSVVEDAVEPELSLGNGYGQSKWVSEMVLRKASEVTALQTTIIRAGQICGSAEVAYWNTSDWFPAMVRSSIALGCFPTQTADVSWIQTDHGARFVVKARNSTSPFLHLIHPNPTTWDVVARIASSLLSLPLCSYSNWVAKLTATAEKSDKMPVDTVPALKILPFFQNSDWSHGKDAMGLPVLDFARARSVWLDAGPPPQMTDKDIEAWVNEWKKQGFLE